MVVLGLTGGIACGKSTVAQWLRDRGARIIDADVIARELVAAGSQALGQIAEQFGRQMLLENAELDRARLGAHVFADALAREQLNAILHPLIRQSIAEQVEDARAQAVAVAVIDAALLLELGANAQCDAVLTIECARALQLQRLMSRNQLDETAASQRIAAQISPEQRAMLAAGFYRSPSIDSSILDANQGGVRTGPEATASVVEDRTGATTKSCAKSGEAGADWRVDNGGSLAELDAALEVFWRVFASSFQLDLA